MKKVITYQCILISIYRYNNAVIWTFSSSKLFKFQNRKFVASMVDFPLPLYIFCAILYFTRSWQNLHYAVATACAFGAPLLFFIIPESPRLLIMHNRKEEAIKIFLQVFLILLQFLQLLNDLLKIYQPGTQSFCCPSLPSTHKYYQALLSPLGNISHTIFFLNHNCTSL